jgi:hypothetical protein
MTDTRINSVAGNKRLMCVDALRGFDMLWIIGGGDVIIALAKAYPNSFFQYVGRTLRPSMGAISFL